MRWMTSRDRNWTIKSLDISHDYYYHPDFGKKPNTGIFDDLLSLTATTAENLRLQNTGEGMYSRLG